MRHPRKSTPSSMWVIFVFSADARLEERLHQVQHTFISDTPPHPIHQWGVRDFVEARRDVTLDNPLVGVVGEHDRLGDRVLGPAPGTEPVTARKKLRLEN